MPPAGSTTITETEALFGSVQEFASMELFDEERWLFVFFRFEQNLIAQRGGFL